MRESQRLAHVASLQDIPAEKAEGADLGDHSAHGKPPILKEEQVVASKLGRGDPIEARARVLAKRLHDLDVAADGRGGLVATDELLAQALQ